MRDPNRIPVVLDALRKTWEQSPDLRLCQLFSSLAVLNGKPDPFYVEDDTFMEWLAKWQASAAVRDTRARR